MLRYFIKRIIWLVPTLAIVTIIGFWLFSLADKNPLDKLSFTAKRNYNYFQKNTEEELKKYWINKLGLNLPVFYFSIQSQSEPDTLYKITDKNKREQLKKIVHQTGNYKNISDFLLRVKEYLHTVNSYQFNRADSNVLKSEIQDIILNIENASDTSAINFHINALISIHQTKKISTPIHSLLMSYFKLCNECEPYKNYLPKIVWHGFKNRYHQWLFGSSNSKGIIHGDFGVSYSKKTSVAGIIKEKMLWSLCMSVFSIIIAYIISIPLSKKLIELTEKKSFISITNAILFILYCTPVFFMGIFLLMIFSNPSILSILPPSGIKPIGGYSKESILTKISETIPYLILPMICYTYSSVVYITKTLSNSIEEELQKNYIKTAKAKGLSQKAIIQHAFKNSLIPIITIFSQLFPFLIGGSVIIESIFTIPGIGLEIVNAVLSNDYPVIIGITTITSILTILSYLIADILYMIIDPRIRIND